MSSCDFQHEVILKYIGNKKSQHIDDKKIVVMFMMYFKYAMEK